jgi:hypothetical protein
MTIAISRGHREDLTEHWQLLPEHGSGGTFHPIPLRRRVTAPLLCHPSDRSPYAMCVAALLRGTLARDGRHATVSEL